MGAQVRYLIGWEHGWMSGFGFGFGFGAAALQLRGRDRWIGWEAQARRQSLHRLVSAYRFRIHSAVRCQYLSSCGRGMALLRLASDCAAQYGFRSRLAESIVDMDHFVGGKYRAANWVAIGHANGRGRPNRKNQRPKSTEERKSFAWIRVTRQCKEFAAKAPVTWQFCGMDRKADLYEFSDEERRSRVVELLVRAKHDGATSKDLNRVDPIRQGPHAELAALPCPVAKLTLQEEEVRGTSRVRAAHRAGRLAQSRSRVPTAVEPAWETGPGALQGTCFGGLPPGGYPTRRVVLADDLLDRNSSAG